MRKLQINATLLVKALIRLGFMEVNTKSNHIKMIHVTDSKRHTTIPNHKGINIAPGTLHNILKRTGISIDELNENI